MWQGTGPFQPRPCTSDLTLNVHEMHKMPMSHLSVRDIVNAAGGPTQVGRAIGRLHSTVIRWKEVPPKYARVIAQMSGLSLHEICPEVFGPESKQIAHVQTTEHRGAA